jgi:hypothetical protein
MNNEVRIDLPELGADHFLLIRNPKSLPWGLSQKLAGLAEKAKKGDELANMSLASALCVALVKGGLIHDWDDKPIDLANLDEATVEKFPTEAVVAVINRWGELQSQAGKVAKKS